MLRHYSTSRVTVLSVALPVDIGILGWVLVANTSPVLSAYLLAGEALLFCYVVGVSVFFSNKTSQMRRLLIAMEGGRRVSVYNTVLGSRSFGRRSRDYGPVLGSNWLGKRIAGYRMLLGYRGADGPHLDVMDRGLVLLGLAFHVLYYVGYTYVVVLHEHLPQIVR